MKAGGPFGPPAEHIGSNPDGLGLADLRVGQPSTCICLPRRHARRLSIEALLALQTV